MVNIMFTSTIESVHRLNIIKARGAATINPAAAPRVKFLINCNMCLCF